MATVLVAASPEPRAILERILAGHELWCVETLTHAEQSLGAQTFDLILCTILFDESRMFDLLRLAKSRREWQRIPFVCVRVRRHIVDSPIALQAVAYTCQALGAAAFLNITDYQTNPEQEMLNAIERFLDPTSQRDT